MSARIRRCWCGRPVAPDYPDAIECANHDDPPPREELEDRRVDVRQPLARYL